MRAVAAVAFGLVLGACATFGGGEPDAYGIYDVVTVNGESWPTAEGMEGWTELKADGTTELTVTVPGQPNQVSNGEFTLGTEVVDGCIAFNGTGEDGSDWTGSICGDVFTVEGPETSVVMHRRN